MVNLGQRNEILVYKDITDLKIYKYLKSSNKFILMSEHELDLEYDQTSILHYENLLGQSLVFIYSSKENIINVFDYKKNAIVKIVKINQLLERVSVINVNNFAIYYKTQSSGIKIDLFNALTYQSNPLI